MGRLRCSLRLLDVKAINRACRLDRFNRSQQPIDFCPPLPVELESRRHGGGWRLSTGIADGRGENPFVVHHRDVRDTQRLRCAGVRRFFTNASGGTQKGGGSGVIEGVV